MNRTLYISMMAFAAAAAANAQSTARAEEPGHADLMQLIHEDLDARQADFTLALADAAGRKFNARMAKIDNVFGPLAAEAPRQAEKSIAAASAAAGGKLGAIVMASAEFEIGKDAANIESPFNPRLPMAPAIVAFEGGEF